MHRSVKDGSILLAKNRTDHPIHLGPRLGGELRLVTEFSYVFTPLSLHKFFG